MKWNSICTLSLYVSVYCHYLNKFQHSDFIKCQDDYFANDDKIYVALFSAKLAHRWYTELSD